MSSGFESFPLTRAIRSLRSARESVSVIVCEINRGAASLRLQLVHKLIKILQRQLAHFLRFEIADRMRQFDLGFRQNLVRLTASRSVDRVPDK